MDHCAPHVDYRRQRLQHEAEVRRLIDPQDGSRPADPDQSGRTLRQAVAVLAGLIALTGLTAGAVALGALELGTGVVPSGRSAWHLR
jgi:hypothetical protein